MGGDLLNIGILTLRSEGKNAVARYRPRVPPSLGAALRLAVHAARREAWLVPVAAGVAAARAALLWPAFAFLASTVVRAALEGFRARPLDPAAPLGAALVTLAAPRVLALYAGLALAGVLL